MDELSKSYTLTHSPDGWRVNFASGISPAFGLEPYDSLFDVIERVGKRYQEYRPRLNENQPADYTFQLKHRVDENSLDDQQVLILTIGQERSRALRC